MISALQIFSVIFADNFSGLVSADSLPEFESVANTQLKLLAKWYKANKLSVQPCKSKYIISNNNNSKINLKDKSVQVLGIYLEEKYVEIISSKVAIYVYGICKIKRFLSRTSLRLPYFANVHSHLNYCDLLVSRLTNLN